MSPAEPSATTRPIYVDLRPKDPFHPARHISVHNWRALGKSLFTSLKFLAETEVHVYAFAVAVNVLISFYPFLVAMILICRNLLHWQAAVDVMIQMVSDFFPGDFGWNPRIYLQRSSQLGFSWLSLFLLFFTANGIFTPLEVAFNRIWRAKCNRNFLHNQVVSLAVIFLCGSLVLVSICFTTLNAQFFTSTFGSTAASAVVESVVLHLAALPVTMLMIFLVYYLLPNADIPVARLIPASVVVSVLLQISEYVNLWTWPWLHAKLRADVPPFVQSVAIVFWAFMATLIILAGAEWAARVKIDAFEEQAEPIYPA